MKNDPVHSQVRMYLYPSLLVLLIVFEASCLRAQFAPQPLTPFATCDGVVNSIMEVGDVVYFGGNFSKVSSQMGSGVRISEANGSVRGGFPAFQGAVTHAVADSDGGLFAAGSFVQVGGISRSGLVRMLPDGTVDAAWAPQLSGGTVRALLLSGNTLFIGGDFTEVNGSSRAALAALDRVTGALLPWNPGVVGTVFALQEDSGVLYVAGEFTELGGQPRRHLGGVRMRDGQATSWDPQLDDRAETLAISSKKLFVGGLFSTVASQTRSRAASFSLGNGELNSWNPRIDRVGLIAAVVHAIVATNGVVYLGGDFDRVGDSPRVNLAAVSDGSGNALNWDVQADPGSGPIPANYVASLAVSGNHLLVGGLLGGFGAVKRPYLAQLDLQSGLPTSWNPEPNLTVQTIVPLGEDVFLGGAFTALGGVNRKSAAAFNRVTGRVTDWDPQVEGEVLTMVSDGSKIYLGGVFQTVAGQGRANLAAVAAEQGNLTDWNPGASAFVISLARRGGKIYAGGGFSTAGGLNRLGVVELDAATGAATTWDAQLNRAAVRSLLVHGDTLYVCGRFSQAKGSPRGNVASFNLSDGSLLPWDPSVTGTVECIAVAEDRVYLGGGAISAVKGEPRQALAAVDAISGSVLPWNPGSVFQSSGPKALAIQQNLVLAVGPFTLQAGQTYSYVAAFDALTAQPTSWNPSPPAWPNTVVIVENRMYLGGVFFAFAGQPAGGLVAFTLPGASRPMIDKTSLQRMDGGQFRFLVIANGASQITIRTSGDLLTWQHLGEFPVVNGQAEVVINLDAPGDNHFFQAETH